MLRGSGLRSHSYGGADVNKKIDSAAKRRRKIIEIIENNRIDSQDTLKDVLVREGYNISQPTLSRDIKALNLTKVPTADGGYRYGRAEVTPDSLDLQGICQTFIRLFDTSGTMVVLKTQPGTATVVGRSLDDAGWQEIAGTLAGTDTVFVACREGVSPQDVINKIKLLIHKSR